MKITERCFQESGVNSLYMLNLFLWNCFTHFSKTTAPKQVIFKVAFYDHYLNVKLWKFVFYVIQKVPKPYATPTSRLCFELLKSTPSRFILETASRNLTEVARFDGGIGVFLFAVASCRTWRPTWVTWRDTFAPLPPARALHSSAISCQDDRDVLLTLYKNSRKVSRILTNQLHGSRI